MVTSPEEQTTGYTRMSKAQDMRADLTD